MRTRGMYDSRREQLICGGLGLAGEAGEFADLVKKNVFHLKQIDEVAFMKELGDVFWYAALIADARGWDLETVLVLNIEKLKKRYPEGFSYTAANNRKE